MPERLNTMPHQPKRQPTFTTDSDGDPIAIMPLAQGEPATVDADVLDELVRQGVTLNWTWNLSGDGYGYVRAEGPVNLVTIARVIMKPPLGFIVRYRNGNRRDLRRKNLYLERGGRAKR